MHFCNVSFFQGFQTALRIFVGFSLCWLFHLMFFSFACSFRAMRMTFTSYLPIAVYDTKTQVAWTALHQVGDGAALSLKPADTNLDTAEEGNVTGGAGVSTQLAEGIGGGGGGGGGSGDLSDRKAAPADATGLNLTVLAVADSGGEEETGSDASEPLLPRGGLPNTGLGDEEGTVSDMSEPLLPRGGSGDRSSSS